MTAVEWNHDPFLLDRLAEALREGAAVPQDFVEAGQAAFVWHDIDAELAALVYDSELHQAAARADVASLRSLTFATARVTIELTFMPDALVGQVLPERAVRVQLRTDAGVVAEVVADHLGVFTVDSPPRIPFSVCCLYPDDVDVITPLITQ